MSRPWTLRYFAQKLELSAREVIDSTAPGAQLTDYARKFYSAFNKPLTMEMHMGGAAMLPTLGQPVKPGAEAATEKLLVRQIPNPSASSIFVGDVVAFKNPVQQGSGGHLVRRVAASEGDEMVSSSPDDEAFVLQPGQCWVVADNAELKPSEALDSRSFGPLELSSITGRVLYYHRSANEHGAVENSESARQLDEPVLECELDIERL